MSKDKMPQTIIEEKSIPKQTIADQLWTDIKDKQLNMFGLPDQVVSKYCQQTLIEPNKLYLTYKIGAVLPALEEAFGKKYNFELLDKFIVVSLRGF